jgi:hypothetical protein
MSFTGRCLCGAVHYTSNSPAIFMGNCYCRDCQRESGTGHITAVAVPDPSLTIGGPAKDFTKPSDSGQTIRNTFCQVCGTTVCTHPSGLPGLALIRAGTLDDTTPVAPQVNMYVASAPVWDPPSAAITGYAGMAPARR